MVLANEPHADKIKEKIIISSELLALDCINMKNILNHSANKSLLNSTKILKDKILSLNKTKKKAKDKNYTHPKLRIIKR